jgi:two-component system response regulator LytT
MMIRAIIVDDEAPARSELRYLLEESGQVEVVAEAANVQAAIEALSDNGADAMFLDIQMPGVNGLQLAEALGRIKNPPAVVFVTAFSQHGTRAFDVNAVDYLVKPVDPARLLRAIGRISAQCELNKKSQSADRLSVEKGGKKLLLDIEKIRYITAKDDYSYLYTDQGRYLSTVSLTQLEAKLEQHRFYRTHRRYIVNLAFVEEMLPSSGGTLQLKVEGEDERIPVSRRRTPTIKKGLGL